MDFKRHKWYHDYACSSDEAYCLVCRKTDSELKGQNECLGQPPSELTQLRAKLKEAQGHKLQIAIKSVERAEKAEASLAVAVKALGLYADEGFYHACTFLFDSPTGGFDEDFSIDDGSDYDRPMPGKLGRQTLKEIKEG